MNLKKYPHFMTFAGASYDKTLAGEGKSEGYGGPS